MPCCISETDISFTGCRAGAACPFRHEAQSSTVPNQAYSTASAKPENAHATASPPTAADATSASDTSTTQVPKGPASPPTTFQRPVAQAEKDDPASFQVNQIRRRFSPTESKGANGDLTLTFDMPITDPDFPFDIDRLNCSLHIPNDFLTDRKPSLRIRNEEMERGFQVNVEQGFDAIWHQSARSTLLNTFKLLDRQLEALLTAQKAEIIKVVANAGPKPAATPAPRPAPASAKPPPEPAIQPQPPTPQKPAAITPAQRQQAWSWRKTETQILEHRLGRSKEFSKAANDTIFTLPLEPRKRDELPSSLRDVRTVRLLVPTEYSIESASVELLGVSGEDAAKIERAFTRRAKANPKAGLLAQLNYLASSMHIMLREGEPQPAAAKAPPVGPTEASTAKNTGAPDESKPGAAAEVPIRETDKAHVKIVARPPEWDAVPSADEDAGSGYSEESERYTDDEDAGKGEATPKQNGDQAVTTSAPRERGIMLSLPGLELHGIELLELTSVNITVKCDRCKESNDIIRLRPSDEPSSNSTANEMHLTCKKCAYPFTLGFRKDILHANSTRAGYLDIDGASIVDLLPSSFTPTCSSCSTTYTAAGITATRAQSALGICRECHNKFSFSFPEVKFLRVSSASHHLPLKQAPRPKKEALGIVAGTELPRRGTCKHYSKSYRWFRFSCCNKVYPCDKCHDDARDHPNEFANRMICGWCSREQPFKPEECAMQGCKRGITGKTGSGFWEGGKGTRDPSRMSRKDPRKYKRAGGGTVSKKYQ